MKLILEARKHTGRTRACQRDSLEPHREEIHDREVAIRNKKILDANKDWNLLAQEKGCEDRFRGDEKLKKDEGDKEHACHDERCEN